MTPEYDAGPSTSSSSGRPALRNHAGYGSPPAAGRSPPTSSPFTPSSAAPSSAHRGTTRWSSPALPPLPSISALSLRFSDPAMEAAYLGHQTSRFLPVDRFGFWASFLMLLISFFVRGNQPACHAILAAMSLVFCAHACALVGLQPAPPCELQRDSRPGAQLGPGPPDARQGTPDLLPMPSPGAPPPPPQSQQQQQQQQSSLPGAPTQPALEPCQARYRTAVIAALRLAYAAVYACFASTCRRSECMSCSPSPSFGRSFAIDTGAIIPVFQTIATPLPFRAHAAVCGATLGLLVVLHNQEACSALSNSCYAYWFESTLRQHHRIGRWALLAARPFLPRAAALWVLAPFGPLHACWCSLLFTQVVAGLLLPACAVYFVEEAARRRYLAGWRRRQQQQQLG